MQRRTRRTEPIREVKKENKRFKIAILTIFIATIVIFSSLIGYMLLSYSRYNLIRVRVSNTIVINDNITIGFLFIGRENFLPNGTLGSGDLYSGFTNEQAQNGFNDIFEEFNQKLLIPIEIILVKITMLYYNISSPGSPQQIATEEIILIKSQEFVITEIDVLNTASPITYITTDTNFFTELLLI